MNGLTEFIDDVARLVENGERQYGIANANYTEYFVERLEICILSCIELKDFIEGRSRSGLDGYCATLSELIECLKRVYYKWLEYEGLVESLSVRSLSYQAPSFNSETTGPGRPPFYISKDQLVYLISMGFKWTEIAAILNVSRTTIYRRRVEFGLLQDPTSNISDDDLVAVIREIKVDAPYSGVQMICGSLRSRGLHITRERVRSTLRAIDPLGGARRWPGGLTRRRPYSVPGPNSLWHIDSHHKLIRWRFITHGGIDGYSRLILYLQCCTNNRASTVYELFIKAAQEYHLPSRVRCDQGLENVAVARHMIEKRGAERRSMLVGNSTHNQRVERMWRDMHKSATILYYRLFYFMEQQELLDPLNEYHLWALHYVFLPRINKTLREFVRSWNHHPMRTTSHKSPSQLFTAGTILLQNSELPGLDFFLEVDENYGIDPDGPIANDNNQIDVPQTSIHFSERRMEIIRETVDPCGFSDNFGIDLYEQTLGIILSFT